MGRSRRLTIQRVLLLVGLALFTLGISITVGVPPIEALPDLDPSNLPWDGDRPEWGDLTDPRDLTRDDLPGWAGSLLNAVLFGS